MGRQAGRQAGWQTIISLFKKFSRRCNSTSNAYFKGLKTFLGLIALYQYVYGWIFGRILLQGCLLAHVFFQALKFSLSIPTIKYYRT